MIFGLWGSREPYFITTGAGWNLAWCHAETTVMYGAAPGMSSLLELLA